MRTTDWELRSRNPTWGRQAPLLRGGPLGVTGGLRKPGLCPFGEHVLACPQAGQRKVCSSRCEACCNCSGPSGADTRVPLAPRHRAAVGLCSHRCGEDWTFTQKTPGSGQSLGGQGYPAGTYPNSALEAAHCSDKAAPAQPSPSTPGACTRWFLYSPHPPTPRGKDLLVGRGKHRGKDPQGFCSRNSGSDTTPSRAVITEQRGRLASNQVAAPALPPQPHPSKVTAACLPGERQDCTHIKPSSPHKGFGNSVYRDVPT